MNIFHVYYILVNSNKIPMCAGEIQWGYLFHFPARGQPSMTSNNDTSQVGGSCIPRHYQFKLFFIQEPSNNVQNHVKF